MIPLAAIVRRLAAESYGLKVPDAAEAFGTPEAIHKLCKAAGFRDVQVYLLPSRQISVVLLWYDVLVGLQPCLNVPSLLLCGVAFMLWDDCCYQSARLPGVFLCENPPVRAQKMSQGVIKGRSLSSLHKMSNDLIVSRSP